MGESTIHHKMLIQFFKTGVPQEFQMKKKWLRFVIIGIVIVGCFFGIFYCLLPVIRYSQVEDAPRCSPAVGDFSEANLVGTWIAGRPDQMDTLIIRADGTYKQIVHVEFPKRSPIDYESGWQPWNLEYSEDDIAYLHLDGMRFCGMNPSISCDVRDGDGHDFCRNEYLPMNGEGILLVLEASGESSDTNEPNYIYYLHYPLGSENSWTYSLKKP
jgi:hypothetical protein